MTHPANNPGGNPAGNPANTTPSSVPAAHLVPDTGFDPAALVLAVIVPGLGHMIRHERWRGGWICGGVLGLFFGGILIGGIDVVDSKEDRVWFLGEALVGPVAFGVDYIHQRHLKVLDPELGVLRSAFPDEGRDSKPPHLPVPGGTPPNTKSIGRVNELGTLFATIAGMVNLIAIVDAGFPTRRRTVRAGSVGAGPVGTGQVGGVS